MKFSLKKMALLAALGCLQNLSFISTSFAAECFSEDDMLELEKSAAKTLRDNTGCLSADEADDLIKYQSPGLSEKRRRKIIAQNRIHLSPAGQFRTVRALGLPTPAVKQVWVNDPGLVGPRQIMSRRTRILLKEQQHRQNMQLQQKQREQQELRVQQDALTKLFRLIHKGQHKNKQAALLETLKKGGTITPEGELSPKAFLILAGLNQQLKSLSPVIRPLNPEEKE